MMPPLQFLRFENGGLNLYGTLHMPEGDGPHPIVVMCHGFTGHRVESSRAFVKAARSIAEAGFAAFRFDCRGSGESDGAFRDMTISTEVSDALTAVDLAVKLPGIDGGRLGLLGFSMGGTVAAETADRRPDVRTLCLWAPVAFPREQFPTIGAMPGDSMDVGPEIVGRGFAEDLGRHAPVEAARRWGGPLIVIRGSKDPVIDEDHARAYLEGPGPRRFVAVEGADHGWASVDHQCQLFAATVDWFRETL